MKNYLVVTPFFPNNKSFRGSYIYDQIKEIKNQTNYNISVIILNNFYKKSIEKYSFDGIECYTFNNIELPSFIFPGLFSFINKRRFKRFLEKNKLKINKEDIVHGHISFPSLFYLYFIKTNFDATTLLQHHGLDVLQLKTGRIFKGWLSYVQEKYLINTFIKYQQFLDLNIGVSKKVITNLESYFKNNIKSYVLYNGVDTSKFFPIKTANNETYTIGCVANFWKTKDHITLLKAVKHLESDYNLSTNLILVGTGVTKKSCVQYSSKHNLNVRYIDEIKHDELNVFYNSIDLFVLPSYDEAFGCVFTEAWACRKPFISVKGQGIEELLSKKQKSIQLIEKEDHEMLAEKIFRINQDDINFSFNNNLSIKHTISSFLTELKKINSDV